MLTSDLVRARIKGDRLELRELGDKARDAALRWSEDYIAILGESVGQRRAAVKEALADIPVPARGRKVADGLLKLLDDRSTWAMEEGATPMELREAVFARAGALRAALGPGEILDREAVLAEVGAELGLSAEQLDDRLFGDLKAAHVLREFEPISAPELLAKWELGQRQAVLLKATRVRVDVKAAHPSAYRNLFRKLKFLRLLHSLHRRDDGSYRIVVDGPAALFSQTTKYGLQLALLIPALDACGAWTLSADVRWGQAKRALSYEAAGHGGGGAKERLSDDVQALVKAFRKLKTDWTVRPATKILDLPGAGLCVPDLVFTKDGEPVYFEVMGFWSRDAVWKRVELVERGLPQRVVFSVSSRLRVSEAALDDELPGALYVYKGVMNARRVLEKIEAAL